MALLEQHPPHVRRKVAFWITAVLGIILVSILVFTFLHPKPARDTKANTGLRDFYTTILENTQSYFSSK